MTDEEEFTLRCLLLSGLKGKLANMVSGGGQIVNQYPPQQVQYETEYVYYYPEYEYIYVDYPYMPEYTNGYYEYYTDGGNGYYQVIELDDGSFFNDPYFNGQGPYYIYREQHQDKDYYFTNRKIQQNKIQKFRISKQAYETLTKKNENVRRQILANREETKPQQQQQQQQERRPSSNVQMVQIPMRPTSQPTDKQTPNVQVIPLGARQATQQPQQQNPSPQYAVVGRQQMPPRGAILVRAPVS